jgi:hypothetical protein
MPKPNKTRLRKVAQFSDKAMEFLHRANGEAYNLGEYQTLINSAIAQVTEIYERAKAEAEVERTKKPENDDPGLDDIRAIPRR